MANRGINKVILIGYLGHNPEIRHIPNGGVITNISIATSDTWRDKQNGEIREKTEWHRVVIFGKLAEIAGEYLRKGSQVYIEGSLQTRKWKDQNGQDRYITEILVNINGALQMLGNRQVNNINDEQKINWKTTYKKPINEIKNKQINSNFENEKIISSDLENNNKLLNNETNIDFDDDIPF